MHQGVSGHTAGLQVWGTACAAAVTTQRLACRRPYCSVAVAGYLVVHVTVPTCFGSGMLVGRGGAAGSVVCHGMCWVRAGGIYKVSIASDQV